MEGSVKNFMKTNEKQNIEHPTSNIEWEMFVWVGTPRGGVRGPLIRLRPETTAGQVERSLPVIIERPLFGYWKLSAGAASLENGGEGRDAPNSLHERELDKNTCCLI